MDDRCRSASTLRLRMPFLLRELPNFSLGAAYRYRHAGEVPVEPPTVPHHGVTRVRGMRESGACIFQAVFHRASAHELSASCPTMIRTRGR